MKFTLLLATFGVLAYCLLHMFFGAAVAGLALAICLGLACFVFTTGSGPTAEDDDGYRRRRLLSQTDSWH